MLATCRILVWTNEDLKDPEQTQSVDQNLQEKFRIYKTMLAFLLSEDVFTFVSKPQLFSLVCGFVWLYIPLLTDGSSPASAVTCCGVLGYLDTKP